MQVFPDLDLNGTLPGVWLAHTAFGLPLAVYLLRNYIGSLPSSIIESAKIDGADHFTIFWRLVVPLSVPALAAFAIFQFLWVWNDFLVAYVFLGGTRDLRVLTIALAGLGGPQGQEWHLLTAAAFITMLPLLVFFSLQRYFVQGSPPGREGARDVELPAGEASPLSPRRKWRAITIATLVLVPAFWSLMAGLWRWPPTRPKSPPGRLAAVARPGAAPVRVRGLAFLSEHPRPPRWCGPWACRCWSA